MSTPLQARVESIKQFVLDEVPKRKGPLRFPDWAFDGLMVLIEIIAAGLERMDHLERRIDRLEGERGYRGAP